MARTDCSGQAPKDVKVGVVACGAQFRGCYAPALAAAEAAKALGWTVTIYDGAGTQEKQNGGMLDALSSGANLLLTAALDPDLIQLGLSKAKEAGVPVVSSSAGTDTPNPVITPPNGGLKYVTDVGTDFPAAGRASATSRSRTPAAKPTWSSTKTMNIHPPLQV